LNWIDCQRETLSATVNVTCSDCSRAKPIERPIDCGCEMHCASATDWRNGSWTGTDSEMQIGTGMATVTVSH
jgi:hypothetical protein